MVFMQKAPKLVLTLTPLDSSILSLGEIFPGSSTTSPMVFMVTDLKHNDGVWMGSTKKEGSH